ncbi:AMP-binding protein [Streptomyces sp. NPDC002671]
MDDLFPVGMPAAMMTAYTTLLHDLAADDERTDADLALPVAQCRRRDEVNSATRGHSGRLLHTAFFEHARERAADPALLWQESGRLTHGELAERALRIAGALVRRGVGRGTSVVVTAPKGPDQIAAVFGVLAAGAAYVPVGVDQPAARRDRILELSGARIVLDGTGAPQSPGQDTEVLALTEALADEPLAAPVPAGPEDTAYVIFTSGSTGTPKGVEVSHRAAVNTVEDIDERFDIGAGDRVLAVSALDFDLSVWDVFGLLAEGGALVLVDESDRRDANRWLALCVRHGVTVWNSVPALLDMLLTAADGTALPALLVPAEAPSWKAVLEEVWPDGVLHALDELAARIAEGGDSLRGPQRHLTVAHAWQELTGALGYPQEAGPRPGSPVTAADLLPIVG